MHWLALKMTIDSNLEHQSPVIWCDNIPAAVWIYKFRTSTSVIGAAILQAFATRPRTFKAGTLYVGFISGVYNNIADATSRNHTVNPSDFLASFTSHTHTELLLGTS